MLSFLIPEITKPEDKHAEWLTWSDAKSRIITLMCQYQSLGRKTLVLRQISDPAPKKLPSIYISVPGLTTRHIDGPQRLECGTPRMPTRKICQSPEFLSLMVVLKDYETESSLHVLQQVLR